MAGALSATEVLSATAVVFGFSTAVASAKAVGRTVCVANFARQLRNVMTSDVVSTSAPQTTWTLLIQGLRAVMIVSAPSVTCTIVSSTRINAGCASSTRSVYRRQM